MSVSHKYFIICGLVIISLASNVPMLRSQAVSIASVTGRVMDPSGAAVPRASQGLRP